MSPTSSPCGFRSAAGRRSGVGDGARRGSRAFQRLEADPRPFRRGGVEAPFSGRRSASAPRQHREAAEPDRHALEARRSPARASPPADRPGGGGRRRRRAPGPRAGAARPSPRASARSSRLSTARRPARRVVPRPAAGSWATPTASPAATARRSGSSPSESARPAGSPAPPAPGWRRLRRGPPGRPQSAPARRAMRPCSTASGPRVVVPRVQPTSDHGHGAAAKPSPRRRPAGRRCPRRRRPARAEKARGDGPVGVGARCGVGRGRRTHRRRHLARRREPRAHRQPTPPFLLPLARRRRLGLRLGLRRLPASVARRSARSVRPRMRGWPREVRPTRASRERLADRLEHPWRLHHRAAVGRPREGAPTPRTRRPRRRAGRCDRRARRRTRGGGGALSAAAGAGPGEPGATTSSRAGPTRRPRRGDVGGGELGSLPLGGGAPPLVHQCALPCSASGASDVRTAARR